MSPVLSWDQNIYGAHPFFMQTLSQRGLMHSLLRMQSTAQSERTAALAAGLGLRADGLAHAPTVSPAAARSSAAAAGLPPSLPNV